jgi:metallophosphoesterase superfamily enzyme
MEPLDITNIRDENEKNMRLSNSFVEEVADKEILNIIDEHLDVVFRSDYLRIRDGTYVPKPRREQIIKAINEILKDHGPEEG